jgi:hypothetical protein
LSARIFTGLLYPRILFLPGKSPLLISASNPDRALKLVEIIPIFIPLPSTPKSCRATFALIAISPDVVTFPTRITDKCNIIRCQRADVS